MPPGDEMVPDDILRGRGKFLDFISNHSAFKVLPVNVAHVAEPLLPEVCGDYKDLSLSYSIGLLTLILSIQFHFASKSSASILLRSVGVFLWVPSSVY